MRVRVATLLSDLGFCADDDLILGIADALRSGALPIKLDGTSDDGQTALMAACRCENLTLVKWLLGNGADVNQTDLSNRRCLILCCTQREHGHSS